MPITENQRKLRQKHIGASDSAAILGLDPWRNAADVWWEKTHGTHDLPDNDAITIGNYVEDPLLQWASDKLGMPILKNQYRVSKQNPIFSCTHDALAADDPNVGFEAKSTSMSNDWGEEGTDQVPERVLIQCQHQMYVSDLKVVYVPVLMSYFRLQLKLYRVDRNDELIAEIVDSVTEFWNRYVLTGVEPDDVKPNLSMLGRIKREPGKMVSLEWDVIQDYMTANENRRQAEKIEGTAKAALLAAMGDAEGGECDGVQVTYLEYTANRLDGKALKEQMPDIAAQFTKPSGYRSLKIKMLK